MEPGAAGNLGACAGPGAGNLDLVPVRSLLLLAMGGLVLLVTWVPVRTW